MPPTPSSPRTIDSRHCRGYRGICLGSWAGLPDARIFKRGNPSHCKRNTPTPIGGSLASSPSEIDPKPVDCSCHSKKQVANSISNPQCAKNSFACFGLARLSSCALFHVACICQSLCASACLSYSSSSVRPLTQCVRRTSCPVALQNIVKIASKT